MKAVVAAFNQEKALVGAFSVIVQLVVEPMDRFAALVFSSQIIHDDGHHNGIHHKKCIPYIFITSSRNILSNMHAGLISNLE